MDNEIALKQINDKLPTIPEELVDKAYILTKILNSPQIILGDKLEAVLVS
ncbi:MAG: hypothetical protein L3J75_11760 [Methylococcaceae bacterium]|nr:hypothetical protein [Methylococcaceae bacterium]